MSAGITTWWVSDVQGNLTMLFATSCISKAEKLLISPHLHTRHVTAHKGILFTHTEFHFPFHIYKTCQTTMV